MALKANGVSCLDCDGFANYFKGMTECPEDADHVTEPVYITSTPLGREDDDDFKVGGRALWVYNATEGRGETPRPDIGGELEVDADEIARLIGTPFEEWAEKCHAVSLAIVKARVFDVARVARGTCVGVGSQHSWVVLGNNCYDKTATIVDPTLWSYDDSVEGIWTGTMAKHKRHAPHGGVGSIWEYGKPPEPKRKVIELAVPVSTIASAFLNMCGPLDVHGWAFLANAPVAGWPAAEIIAAMDDTPALSAHVPIDRLGMLTDRNPCGLYLYEAKP